MNKNKKISENVISDYKNGLSYVEISKKRNLPMDFVSLVISTHSRSVCGFEQLNQGDCYICPLNCQKKYK